MSCFIVDSKSFNTAFRCLKIVKCNIIFMKDCFNKLQSALNAEAGKNLINCTSEKYNYIVSNIFRKLNYNAYNGRYNQNNNNFFDIEYKINGEITNKFSISFVYKNNKWYFDKNIYLQMIKSLQCYLYQCSESINNDNNILLCLKNCVDCLVHTYVSNEEEYINADWN